jgi:hypothetical protein
MPFQAWSNASIFLIIALSKSYGGQHTLLRLKQLLDGGSERP